MTHKKHRMVEGGIREDSLEEAIPKLTAVCHVTWEQEFAGEEQSPGSNTQAPLTYMGDDCSAPSRAHLLGIKC